MTIHRKIVSLDKLAALASDARAAGRRVVQCHGCFDIVHPGHIRYLQFARRQGDVLIVTLTGDDEVGKGPDRPYIPEDLRAENLAALEFVDYVSINHAATAVPVLEAVAPDVYVKGHEYENSEDERFLAEKGVVERLGGRIIFSSGDVVFSSTRLIGRLAGEGKPTQTLVQRFCDRYELSRRSLEATIEKFRSLKVLVVGDIVLDHYIFCDASGVASESPMLSLAYLDEAKFVGGAAIVARHLAAMGAKSFLLSGVADDDATALARRTLADEGVETHLIKSRNRLPTKTRYLADDTKLVKIDRAEHQPFDSKHEAEAAAVLERHARGADAVIFCDFGCGTVTGGLLGRTLPMLRHNVGTIAADVSGARANLLNFKHVDLLCPTEREVRAALNDYDSGLSSAAWNLMNQTQARHLIVTLEKRGLVAFLRRSQKRGSTEWSARLTSETLPSFAESNVDRMGCGDAMLAAATLTLAAGNSISTGSGVSAGASLPSGSTLPAAAYLGTAAAALEIAMLGNKPIPAASLLEWVGRRGELEREVVSACAERADLAAVLKPSRPAAASAIEETDAGILDRHPVRH